MNEEEQIELYNGIPEQQNERRKRKKRRGKISNESGENENVEESNPPEETPLITLSSVLNGENDKLPLEYNPNLMHADYGEKLEQESTKKKRRKKRGRREKEKEDENETNEANEANEKPEEIDENEKNKLRSNLNDQFKRTENINKPKRRIEEEDSDGIIPSKDINPKELYENDDEEENEVDELDYLKARKAYDLSVFLDSHKFIKNKKGFDPIFSDLIKRKLIRFERNMYDLVDNDQFFILYELQVSEHTELTLNDMVTLNTIKSILDAFPNNHLIIIISDEELYNQNPDKYDYSLIEEFGKDKLKNVLLFLNLENENRIHAFSTRTFKRINPEFENQKNDLKQLVDKPRLRKLFNIPEDDRNDLLLDYPCYLAVAANPSIYTNFIPDINADCKCLIVNSIYYMNRYLMCFDASKENALNFIPPSAIAIKLVPHLNGFNDLENYGDFDEENMILSSDDNFSLDKKLKKLEDNESSDRNPNMDAACQYLGFLDDDNKNYKNLTENYEKGNIVKRDIINRVYNLLQDLLRVFKEKNNNNIDVGNIMLN